MVDSFPVTFYPQENLFSFTFSTLTIDNNALITSFLAYPHRETNLSVQPWLSKMGLLISKVSNDHARTQSHMDSTEPNVESTKLAQEIESWEEIYRERFTRMVTVPGFWNPDSNRDTWLTYDPLWGFFIKPVVLKLAPEDVERRIRITHPISNCPPRYVAPTPQPLSAELGARTRQELIQTYDWKLAMNTQSRCRSWDCKGFKIGGTTANPHVVSYLNHGDQVPPGLLCKRFLGIDVLSRIAALFFEPGFMRCWEGQCW